jgi:hypothetical protein
MLKNGRSVFQGNAAAAAASITRYRDREVTATIPAQATCSLSSIGGIAEQAVKGFTKHRLAHFLSFESAKAAAEGKYAAARMAAAAGGASVAEGRPVEASVSATVKRARLADRFEAREIRADGRFTGVEAGEDNRIQWSGSYVKGLKLDGFAIDVEFEPEGAQSAPRSPRNGSYSIVRGIQTKHPEAIIESSNPNVLQLPGFGSVVFGEVLTSSDMERLTLLRFELDGSDSGSAALCEVQLGLRSIQAPQRRRAAVKGQRSVVHRLVDDGLSGMPV